MSTGISFDSVNASIGAKATKASADLAAHSKSMDPNSTSDMLAMQQKMQQWSMMINLQSTIVKEVGDTLKGIVQKSG